MGIQLDLWLIPREATIFVTCHRFSLPPVSTHPLRSGALQTWTCQWEHHFCWSVPCAWDATAGCEIDFRNALRRKTNHSYKYSNGPMDMIYLSTYVFIHVFVFLCIIIFLFVYYFWLIQWINLFILLLFVSVVYKTILSKEAELRNYGKLLSYGQMQLQLQFYLLWEVNTWGCGSIR